MGFDEFHMTHIEDNIQCPYCGKKDIKNNGDGHFRCRDCDTDFKLKHYAGDCEHTWEYFRRCEDCGKREKKYNNGKWLENPRM